MKQGAVRDQTIAQHAQIVVDVNIAQNKEEHVVSVLLQVNLKKKKNPKVKRDNLIIIIVLKKITIFIIS